MHFDGQVYTTHYRNLVDFFLGLTDQYQYVDLYVPLEHTNRRAANDVSFDRDRVNIVGLPYYEGAVQSFLVSPWLMLRSWQLCRKHLDQWDVLICVVPSLAGLVFSISSYLASQKVVHLVRGNRQKTIQHHFSSRPALAKFLQALTFFPEHYIKWSARKGTLTYVLGQELKDIYGANCNSIHIFRGLLPNEYSIGNRDRHDKFIKPRILYVGRLSEEKGLDDLINAVAEIDNSNFDLRIVGDGPYRELLEQQVIAKGLQERFEFVGQKSFGPELFVEYENADIFILPSHTEGMPRSIAEAMGKGLPVISTQVGGIPEMVTSGENGILVSPGDVAGLASAIQMLIENSELRKNMSEASLARADLLTERSQRADLYEMINNHYGQK